MWSMYYIPSGAPEFTPGFSGVYLQFKLYVVFCRSFVSLSFFYLRLLITSLVSSDFFKWSSYINFFILGLGIKSCKYLPHTTTCWFNNSGRRFPPFTNPSSPHNSSQVVDSDAMHSQSDLIIIINEIKPEQKNTTSSQQCHNPHTRKRKIRYHWNTYTWPLTFLSSYEALQ